MKINATPEQVVRNSDGTITLRSSAKGFKIEVEPGEDLFITSDMSSGKSPMVVVRGVVNDHEGKGMDVVNMTPATFSFGLREFTNIPNVVMKL